jgi:hypothetical protein
VREDAKVVFTLEAILGIYDRLGHALAAFEIQKRMTENLARAVDRLASDLAKMEERCDEKDKAIRKLANRAIRGSLKKEEPK